MTSQRTYPETAAGSFPVPPVTFTDREDRSITVRAFESEDLPALVEMYDGFDPADRAQGIPPIGEDRIRNWLDHLLEEGSKNVVAVSDEAVVGHATLVEDDDDGYELAIFVHQDFQGAGIGTRLLRTLLGYGQSEGVEKVWLTVERWNRPAVKLYEKVGFETTEAESFELEMAIRLSPE
ncbi:Acetyltransferase (GNAT) family [Halanaeroarchaeum sp. HSR-CO]|uniref:GNAT family N-acetyltransferase n=1 Tax=Halanaeroarchaeum sp. HSR-CO TaxID=2866382 RepID=UPI00217D895E|nr:GNAT family N-acetyltransferase [Halanaeroarchaeum sp. HSR-CO]UWG46699.1 Acetyltransferase (GNAT) family [Halanaeroarchaeum sp. HSR-CO]